MLKKYSQKVMIVDNEPEEIESLFDTLNDLGFNVDTHVYSQLDRPLYENYRVYFFDLNITPHRIEPDMLQDLNWETNSSVKTVCEHLAQAIKNVVSTENGPYALILWTKHQELVSALKKYIIDRYAGNDFPHPFFISYIDKFTFGSNSDKVKVVETLFDDTILKSLMDFEHIVNEQAYDLISEIIKLANPNILASWKSDEVVKENFISLLRTMAVTSAGYNIAKENPSKALAESITPILKYKVEKSSESDGGWNEILDISSIESKDIFLPEGFEISKLNNFFHIDSTPINYNDRGATFEISQYKDYFKQKNGIDADLVFEKAFGSLYKKLIESGVFNEVGFIITELSAACDYSQDKDRVHKYILGFTIPFQTIMSFGNAKKINGLLKSSNDSSYLFNNLFNMMDDDKYIAYSFNHVFSIDVADRDKFTHIFTLKKEMMDSIGSKYSKHISRIGITAF